uniref:Zinc finger protein 827 n=1 Tax=Knipowitschia caucasica TaxID=637954 RepID=A0AAV2LN25_KNICA
MPRRKQEQPKRLPSQLDGHEGGPDTGPVEEEGWFGNASDTRSESSYGDTQDELLCTRGSSPEEGHAASAGSTDHETCGADSSLGGSTPVHRASLELLGLDGGVFSAQDTLSSVVSSLYGEAASRALGKPLSSNLRRLLEAGSLKLDSSDLLGRSSRGESPPIGLAPPLTLSPSSHHAQQLSALARKLANNNSGSASPASLAPSVTNIKQEPLDPFNSSSNGSGFVWAGVTDKWPPASCSTPCGSSLSPDSAIQKLKAAANAVLQDKSAVASSTSSSSSSTSSVVPALGTTGRTDDMVRFDAFNSPFSPQSASSTLAALSKKVSERNQASTTSAASDHQSPASSFLSLVSMTSSAALLKEVAARAAGNLLAEKKEGSPLSTSTVLQEDVKPLLEKNQKTPTPTSTPTPGLELLLPSTPKGRAKPISQAGSPEDGGKPFQCPVCGLVIKRKSYWKRHMVIHTGLKSHQCPLCPFRCARKDNLKSHMKVHQHQDRGETFQCELCPFTSSRHFSLKLHMRCHQHFPRTDLKVKEELTTDTEGEGSQMGDSTPGELRGSDASPQRPDTHPQSSPALEASSNHVHIKEEPQERDLSVLSPFSLCRERPSSSANSLDLPGVTVGVRSSPTIPISASIFSPDISTKTATDLLIKLSAANQRESLKSPFHLKEEPKLEEALSPRPASQSQGQTGFPSPFCHDGLLGATATPERSATLKPREDSPLSKNNLLNHDISMKVASELLIKLSENNKDSQYQKVAVKAEPMEVDPPPAELSPPAPHLLAFSTLGNSDKSEPMSSLPKTLGRPQNDLFSQDISVKMASELLFKLSEKVSKANNHKDANMVGKNSPFLDECFRQSPFNSRSKSSSPAEASSSNRPDLHNLEKDHGEPGNGISQWRLNEQLFPCPICGKVFGRQQTLSRHLALHTEERKYKCHLCPYAAKCRANLNQHLTIHSVKLVSTDTEQIVSAVTADSTERKNCLYYYSCHVCGFQTELNAQFVSHMSLHVDKEQWMFSLCCSVCDYVCMDEGDMKGHVSTGHSVLNSRSPLSETKSTSSSLSALSDSLNSSEGGDHSNEELKSLLAPPSSASSQLSSGSHSGSGTEDKNEKGFECVFCNFVCKTRSMYERHLQIHLITRMFECDVCHKFLKTPEQLLEHKKCHTVPSGGLKVCEALWGPEQMKAVTSLPHTFKHHTYNRSTNSTPPSPALSSTSVPLCPFCIYSTNRPAAMECHLKTHCKMEYRCRICQGLWPDQAALEGHMRAHRLGNHYKCEQCGYLSKTANKLIEHVRVHTGERPFQCDRCSYSCKRKDNLNLHKKLKHAPRQPLGCHDCPFTTTHPFVYSRHVKKHQRGVEEEEEERRESASPAGPHFLLGAGSSGGSSSSSPLMNLSASHALQSAALSLTLGRSLQPLDPPSMCSPLEPYTNCKRPLIPLTTLYTFQSAPRPATSPPLASSSSHKHSFMAYLGLTERAKTV